jgi:hypothetical protein
MLRRSDADKHGNSQRHERHWRQGRKRSRLLTECDGAIVGDIFHDPFAKGRSEERDGAQIALERVDELCFETLVIAFFEQRQKLATVAFMQSRPGGVDRQPQLIARKREYVPLKRLGDIERIGTRKDGGKLLAEHIDRLPAERSCSGRPTYCLLTVTST